VEGMSGVLVTSSTTFLHRGFRPTSLSSDALALSGWCHSATADIPLHESRARLKLLSFLCLSGIGELWVLSDLGGRGGLLTPRPPFPFPCDVPSSSLSVSAGLLEPPAARPTGATIRQNQLDFPSSLLELLDRSSFGLPPFLLFFFLTRLIYHWAVYTEEITSG
jgi:hypothetical protein